MNAERHGRAKELFAAARELSPEQAAHFLDAACGDDGDLRKEVAVLLSLHRELEMAEVTPPKLGTVGNFRVLRLVGEGGMGEVWEAEQDAPLHRTVALKLVKWGMDTRQVLVRFEAERQALALMNHPNIAVVHEAGSTEDGRPYFAMEFVDGEDITSYCDSRRVPVVDRLRLFLDVCDAIQHAHQKGVIHRDLKPSNVLVAEGECGLPLPKVIDFGVAKAVSQRLTEHTLATELGHWIGTPEYMSPEQAGTESSDVDTRSDVYSLGVILHELLVGGTPLDPASLRDVGFDEMRRRIREEEPSRPSTSVGRLGERAVEVAASRGTDVAGLLRALRGDLDWIILKALEKDRARRYRSPAELASDIDRHLRHQPVLACPPSRLYRLGRFVRRNRVAVAAGAVVLAAIIAGSITASVGFVRAQREAKTARSVSGFLESMIFELNPRSRLGHTANTREILDRGAERIDVELAKEPLEVARVMTALGVAYGGLGDFERARSLLEKSVSIRLEHLGPDHPDYATSCFFLGDLMFDVYDDGSALHYHEIALRVRERELPSGHPLVTISADRVAMAHYLHGDCQAALALTRRVLAEAKLGLGTEGPEYQAALLGSAAMAAWCEDQSVARALLDLSLIARHGLSEPYGFGDVVQLFNYATVLHRLGDCVAALEVAERAVVSWEAIGGPEDRGFAAGLFIAGEINLEVGRTERARDFFARVAEIDAAIAQGPDGLAKHRLDLARAYTRLGDHEVALEVLREAVAIGLPADEIRGERGLDSLREHPEFEVLIAAAEGREPADSHTEPSAG